MLTKPICRGCNASSTTQKIRATFVFGGSTDHNFWECDSCGLVYLYPIPSQDEENEFYSQEFEKFMSNRSANDRNWSGPLAHIKTNQDQVKRRWKFLKDYIKPGMTILEVGCSSGFMMDDLHNKGVKVIGIEPSGGFGDFLSQRGHTHYSSIDELVEKEPKLKFDAIIHFFVLEHIRNPIEFLSNQIKLLKPDGVIIAEVPNVDDPLTSLYEIPAFEKFYWSIAHHYYYNPQSLTLILNKLECKGFQFKLEQRYDLSNHITWLQDGKPGGQGKFDSVFSKETRKNYTEDLKRSKKCDTFFLYIFK
jgi:SAM-dependent methyltransferase